MSDAIAFEFQGRTVGVLARHGEKFIFYAGAPAYGALDGGVFSEPRDLYLALRRVADGGRRPVKRDGGETLDERPRAAA
ncbi:MAG: hypothetical protein J0H41_10005 [Rhizobiales bacterium]|nr:hypothetical protein [Hyphomicrobiales bacterium]